MKTLDDQLFTAPSTIPNAGNGLFTKQPIAKGTRITEYLGIISTWKDANHDEGRNAYIYFINNKHVIDAKDSKALAQFANDGMGFKRIKGITNNSEYEVIGKRVFITATKNIAIGAEILVGYGKDYWDTIRKNGIM